MQPHPTSSQARGLFGHLRAAGAFVFRDYHLTRRYFSWHVVFSFYDVVNAATIVLIGVALGQSNLTLTLILGVVMWSFLSRLFGEIANSISYERWEGTIEYTFMAPVSRLVHLLGVSAFAGLYALVRVVIVMAALLLFTSLSVSGANLWGCLVVIIVASFSFMGLGLIAAVLPMMSTENGAQATNIIQAVFLLISGIYYPVSVLPAWLQPLSFISPATYALTACRKLLGIEGNMQGKDAVLQGASLSAVLPELGILVAFAFVTIPLGLYVFRLAERWAKRTGKLKRVG
ncbi:ABC-2 type transport system permease protein [Deinobacterium chartae]|uniref:Transport permease protein n=1 Tax=Deinobacterium chartae TaxID=521158 RepID=A0A841HZZ8_9DEIO|nr:ABC transporter permease [Deinobacterium chartae]MBB6099101.1 ABC-2 type transport system permease protein [Deinobacterium chartae]